MNIEIVIEKFFNGETTVEEERELRRMLEEEATGGNIADKELLLALLPAASKVPADLCDRLSQMIDSVADSTPQQAKTEEKARKGSGRKILAIPKKVWYTLSGAAAIILLIGIIGSGDARPEETFSNPKEAAARIDETLTLFAMALNTGIEKEQEAIKHIGSLQATTENCINEDIFK